MRDFTKQAFKAELFEEFARIGKALSSGRRLELLELLAQGERAVEELTVETGMSIANTSQHLQVLRSARLVDVRRQGTYAWYRLSDANVLRLWLSLREVGEMQLAEIERVVESFFKDRQGLEATTCEDLLKQLEAGGVVVLDDNTCIVKFALRTMKFYRHESCGWCIPCREGTDWLEKTLIRFHAGGGVKKDIDNMYYLSENMLGKTFCPLGDAAAMPTMAFVKKFRKEFEDHLDGKPCPFERVGKAVLV